MPVEEISKEAKRITTERPDAWEYLLFAQVYTDTIESFSHLREQQKRAVHPTNGEDVYDDDVPKWFKARFAEQLRNSRNSNLLLNRELPEALGPAGEPANVEKLISVAQELAGIYKQMIDWSLRIRRANLSHIWHDLQEKVAQMVDLSLERFEGYGPMLKAGLQHQLSALQTGTVEPLTLTLKLDVANTDEVIAEIQRLANEQYN